MESQPPIWLHGRQASNLTILLNNLCRRLSRKEPKVKDAPQSIILEVLTPIGSLVNHDIHAIRIQQKHAVRAPLPVLQVKRLRAIQVRPRRNTVAVLVPHGADVVCGVEAEGVGVLAQAVQVGVLGEFRPQPEVLRLEDEGGGGRVEEDFARVAAADLEGEWGGGVVEFEAVLGCGGGAAGPGEHGCWDLVDLVVFVLDLDMEAVICCC